MQRVNHSFSFHQRRKQKRMVRAQLWYRSRYHHGMPPDEEVYRSSPTRIGPVSKIPVFTGEERRHQFSKKSYIKPPGCHWACFLCQGHGHI